MLPVRRGRERGIRSKHEITDRERPSRRIRNGREGPREEQEDYRLTTPTRRVCADAASKAIEFGPSPTIARFGQESGAAASFVVIRQRVLAYRGSVSVAEWSTDALSHATTSPTP